MPTNFGVLAERARDALTYLTISAGALGGETWTQRFRTLTNAYVGLGEADAFDALRRLDVTVIDEDELKSLDEASVSSH